MPRKAAAKIRSGRALEPWIEQQVDRQCRRNASKQAHRGAKGIELPIMQFSHFSFLQKALQCSDIEPGEGSESHKP